MNEKKMRKLFEAARKEQLPAPMPGFDANVMRAIRREQPASATETVSLFDTLGALFPRMALASALIIFACVAGDYFSSPQDSAGLTDEVAQLSEQWLFVEEEF